MESADLPSAPATRSLRHKPGVSQAPPMQPDFVDNAFMALQHQQQQQQQQQDPAPARAGLAPVIVDRRTPRSADHGDGRSPVVPPKPADASKCPDAVVSSPGVGARSPAPLGVGVSPSSADGKASVPQSPAVAEAPVLGNTARETRVSAAAVVAASDEASTGGAPPVDVPGGARIATASPLVSQQGEAGASGVDTAACPAMMVSAAVSEDLAYVHRGSVLQSYAITGSVLVAASHGARGRLRVTDRQGHIATSTANAAVAAENTASSIPPTREYLCKAGPVQAAGEPPKFLPTLMYRCSTAVKVLPVRVTCRLRSAGNSVIVSTQVIANPQLSQPLSGVSVLVNLPFMPRNEEVRVLVSHAGGGIVFDTGCEQFSRPSRARIRNS